MLDHYVCDGGQTFVINYSQSNRVLKEIQNWNITTI